MVNTLTRLVKRIDNIILVSYIVALIICVVSYMVGYATEGEFLKTNNKYTFYDIFFNNMQLSCLFFIGILTFGLLNIVLAILNGYTIGSVFRFAMENYEFNEIILKIVPHGIFEIPSLLISISIGFLPGLLIIKKGHSKEKIILGYYLKYVLFCFLTVTLLNIIAAFIEVNISMS